MGVRGLTSFIARHAELYLKPFELHDCNLVIDGDNLACNLYKESCAKNSAFGGDYDAFYRKIVQFFRVLSECNIRAFVLMDGGYEKKKLRTVWQRLRGKIAIIKRIDPVNSQSIFPLMMREVFVDALNDCKIPVTRCVFEGDDELAALSRKLNCPVLSYDSDFYIHNVKYIPLVTLTLRVQTKQAGRKEIDTNNGKLSKSDAKHLEKRAKSQQIIKNIEVNADNKQKPKKKKAYKYLDCCLYKIENLIEQGSLSKEKLPLFAALLGNDYIDRSAFKSFFAQMKQTGMTKGTNRMQKRIRKILQWLKYETAESASEKILRSLKKQDRNKLLAQIEGAVEGYSVERCASYDFFKLNFEDMFKKHIPSKKDDSPQEESSVECESSSEEKTSSNKKTSNEEDTEEEEQDEAEEVTNEKEEQKELDDDTDEEEQDSEEEASDEKQKKKELNDDAEEEEENQDEEETSDDEESTESCYDLNDIFGEDEDEEDNEDEQNTLDNTAFLPQWFKDRLYRAHLPRFMVDLAHLQMYINNPQIEHFTFKDCNEIGLPILKHIFCLFHNVEGTEEKIFKPERIRRYKKLPDHDEFVPYFRYLTRVTRITDVHTIRYPVEPPPAVKFNPINPDKELFRVVFRILKLDTEKLFSEIEKIPSDLQLYFLALIYWIQKTPHADLLHLHSLLICLVVLRTVDSKVVPIRDIKAFQKRYGKIIKKEKQQRSKEQEEGIVKTTQPNIQKLPIIERMRYITMQDCLLVQESLLKHFHMQELFKKKYDAFSSTILHGFSEFQSVVFNLYALNGLLGNLYKSPTMGQTFCGVFLYNIYDLLRSRIDLSYFIQTYIFGFSPMMAELYEFFYTWCEQFIPEWQKTKTAASAQTVSKNVLKKRKAAARKKAAAEASAAKIAKLNSDPNAEMLQSESESNSTDGPDDVCFLNNKFCTLMKSTS